jgi:hypothetical protein
MRKRHAFLEKMAFKVTLENGGNLKGSEERRASWEQ